MRTPTGKRDGSSDIDLDAAPEITGVPSAAGVRVTVTAPIRHLCPFKDEIDDGQLTLSWRTDHSTVELHSLRSFLGAFAVARISHEEVVSEIWGAMNRVDGIRSVSVSTTWRTAGMEVRCATSPTPQPGQYVTP